MNETERPNSNGASRFVSRPLRLALAILGALGIASAVGGWLVHEYLPGAVERILGQGPIIATTQYDTGVYNSGFEMVVPRRAAARRAVAGVNGCSSLLSHGHRAGAVDLGDMYLNLLTEGHTVRGATIVGMRAQVVHRSRPLTGAEISCSGAADVDPKRLTLNLDESDPEAHRVNENGVDKGSYFGGGYAVDLSKGEVASFFITARTKRSYVEWNLALDVNVDGKIHTVVIDDHGHPFRTSASRCGRSTYAPGYEWGWWPKSHRLIRRARVTRMCSTQ